MLVATNPKPNNPLQYLGFEALRQRYEAARKGRGASFFKIKKGTWLRALPVLAHHQPRTPRRTSPPAPPPPPPLRGIFRGRAFSPVVECREAEPGVSLAAKEEVGHHNI